MIKITFLDQSERDTFLAEQTALGLIATLEHNNRDDSGYFEFKTAEEIMPERVAGIRENGEVQLNALVSPYSANERETWPTQRDEAEAYTIDNSATVPLITAMATARGIDVSLLAEKILANVDAFQTVAGVILGEQQKQLDALE